MRLRYFIALIMAGIPAANASLSLDQAIELAIENDPQLQVSRYQEQSMHAKGVVAGQWDDPRISLAVTNLPLNSFETNQEPMTQAKVGIKQMLPRGNSLAIAERQWAELSLEPVQQRYVRQRNITLTVTQHWLDVLMHRKTIALIERDRALFEQLVDIAQSNYASAFDSTSQQDIVRAELALTRLDERLLAQHQLYETSKASLFEWLTYPNELSDDFPALVVESYDDIQDYLLKHPSILAIDQKILASQSGVDLANESYKPQWGVEASYGYREEAENGMSRADFFSVGVSFDVPLSKANRQDQYVKSAVAEREALKTRRSLMLRTMRGQVSNIHARLAGLNQRYDLYQQRLIKQSQEQAEAALNAYTSDTGAFSDVIRARIDGLNARIDTLAIKIERLKTAAHLRYFIQASINEDDQ